MNVTNAKYKGGQVMQPVKQWHIRSAVLAVAVLAGGVSISAQALVLGHIQINSALGEPIKAEIPITKITSDEATSLKINLADANDFTGHGLLYNAAIAAMRVDFKMTGNNTGVISISGMKPVQDPFVDLLLDVRWRTGGMQRSYTMLFDPPEHIADNAVYSSSTPQVSILADTQVGSAATMPQGSGNVPVNRERLADGTVHERIGPSRPTDSFEPPLKGDTSRKTAGKRSESLPQTRNENFSSQVKVGKGQTLGQIAASLKPAGVSQDQMLAALFRANPNAFISQNINLVRAGVTLNVPSESDIASISKGEARNLVRSHNRQFNEYRTQLAGGASRVVPQNESAGTVQVTAGTVESSASTAVAGNAEPALVVTPGTQQEQTTDQTVAADMQAANMNTHLGDSRTARNTMEEISNQINQTGETTTSEPVISNDLTIADTPNGVSLTDVSSSSTVENTPSDGVNPPAVQDALVVDNTPPAPTEGATLAPNNEADVQQETIKVEETPIAPPVTNPAPIVVEESLVEKMLKNPWIPLGGLAAVVLVIFGGLKLLRKRKQNDYSEDDSDIESTNDSFFSDTNESSMLDQSSSIYAASQLDTNADVDPLQEADVYLAYGRDEQAAEILRDAIQADPQRAALHAKLCEIYAKQGNTNRFESQRNQLRTITGGRGADWERVEKLQRDLAGSSSNGEAGQGSTEAVSSGGMQANFASPAQPTAEHDSNAFQANAVNMSDNLPDLEMTDDSFNAAKSDPQTIDFSEPASEIPDEEEGPVTRLALAEEFLAIGNKADAKEIAQEVLSENIPADLKERAQSLLNKAS